MNNRVITIVCIILTIMAVACFGYIFLNSGKEEEQPKVEENTPIDNVSQEDNNVSREERYQNVIITSRIGLQLTNLIKYSEMYADSIIEELDENGLTNDAKILISLDKISSNQKYMSYMEYSEEYFNNYILFDNMSTVVSDIFVDKNIERKQLQGTLTYDNVSDSFIMLPTGFEGGIMHYTLEVPYKIMEYSDRIELLAYRVYVIKTIEMQEAETKIKNDLYYDKAKSNLAYTIEGDSFETNQIDTVNTMIEDNTLNTQNMETVKYTFKLDGESYKISSFEKVNK